MRSSTVIFVHAMMCLGPTLFCASDCGAQGKAVVTVEDSQAAHPALDLSKSPVSAYDRRPGANFLRLHLRFSSPPGGVGNLTLNVIDGLNHSVETVDLSVLRGTQEFWTKVIAGEEYQLNLQGAAVTAPTPNSSLAVIAVVRDVQPIEVQGYAPGGPWWEPVSKASDDPLLQKAAQSVARLQIQPIEGDGWSCTGFLIDGNRLLTNEHCIWQDDQCLGTVAAFDRDDLPQPPDQFKCTALLAHDKALDYALIQLSGAPATVPALELAKKVPQKGDALRVIEHGWEVPERISRSHCALTCPRVAGGLPGSDLEYTCDTIESSSGSPVLNASNQVVALHHWQNPNQGVSISQIVTALGKSKPSTANP